MCPWRALMLVSVLAFGFPQQGLAQAPAPDPAPPPIRPVPQQPTVPLPNDAFGDPVTLTPKPIIFLKGNSTWDNAYDVLVDAFKSVRAYLAKEGIQPAGPSMTIYTQADDTGFQFQAAIPIARPPATRPQGDMEVGVSPTGKALKFVHRGSYDSMDNTYEAITNHLDAKQLEAEDVFVEEYETDLVGTPEDQLVINVYVPLK